MTWVDRDEIHDLHCFPTPRGSPVRNSGRYVTDRVATPRTEVTAETYGLVERVAKALNSQKQATITVLSSLLAVQDELGYVAEEAIEEVAKFTRSTINDVWGVASFYTNFRFTAPGAHTVDLCWGPSCHVQGAMPVIKAALDALGLQGEGDTPDGSVTVRFNTCLAACAQGPVISVDHELMGKVSPERASQIMTQLARSGGLSGPASRHSGSDNKSPCQE